MNHVRIIERGEAYIARRIALATIIANPGPLWLNAIPGMFIVDHFRRLGAVRRYRTRYLAVRRPALAAAAEIFSGSTRRNAIGRAGRALPREYDRTSDARKATEVLLELLVTHYENLLAAEGKSFEARLVGAYGSRDGLLRFLRSMTQAERDLDTAGLDAEEADEATRERVRAERKIADDQRQRHAREVFLG